MPLIEPRAMAALDAALSLIQTTVHAVVDQVAGQLGGKALSSTRIAERDLLLAAQFELRRNMATFRLTFRDVLRERVNRSIEPHDEGRRTLANTDWQSLALVGDDEVEERMYFDRIATMISHECDWQLREIAAYMGGLTRSGRADEDKSPLRAEVLGASLYRAIEAVSPQSESRRLLARDIGQALAQAMPTCYEEILRDLQNRGIRPVGLAVRQVEGPGNALGSGGNSGYQTLTREEWQPSGPPSGFGMPVAGDSVPGALWRGGRTQSGVSSSHAGFGSVPSNSGRHSQSGVPGASGMGPGGMGSLPGEQVERAAPRTERGSLRAGGNANPGDVQLMNLLRRLTALASHPGALDDAPVPRFSASGRLVEPETGTGLGAADGPIAINLIRAHRDELLKASSGKLDHMVIDVVGSLFDQILSDPRVPPQMARQIARLQLPVLRVAMNDASFFTSRRHPVRRFVNRIASLACAFDDFDDGPGKQFLDRVRELVQEIVEGDFDQIELYGAKLNALEHFIGEQTRDDALKTGAAPALESKESELRVHQRYMLQLQTALHPVSMPPYLRDFVSQVWSQALVLAVRREGVNAERAQRYRRAGRDLVMSVQPKGSPLLRKRFLMQLPPLMKDLNDGMKLIGWPEPAQREFFAKLLPAHAESLKAAPMSELDHNLMVKQLEHIFATAVPGTDMLTAIDSVAEVDSAVIEQTFTPEEAKAVGLLPESAVDWSGGVDIDLGMPASLSAAPAGSGVDSGAPAGSADGAETGPDTLAIDLEHDIDTDTPGDTGVDIDLGMPIAPPSNEPPEPTRGAALIDHVRLGFAYQMHLKDEWHKVRLTYVSPGRSFFVFTRGKKHQETISMTARMLARMCETGRFRAVESAYLIERATARARKQLAALAPAAKTRN